MNLARRSCSRLSLRLQNRCYSGSTRLQHGDHDGHGKFLVLDLDGTLIESAGDVTRAINALLDKKGVGRKLAKEQVSPMIGDGMQTLVQRAWLETEGEEIKDKNQLKELALILGEIYDQQDYSETILLPKVYETLEFLHEEEGHHFGLATNKDQKPTEEILDFFKIRKFFSSVVGGDMLPIQKPNAGHLITAVEMGGGEVHEAIMIGDGHNDVLVAHAAGVPSIALRSGYSRIPLEELRPSLIIDTFEEVPDAITRLTDSSMY